MPSRSGLIQPEQTTFLAPNPVFPYGEAMLTRGLEANDTIDGIGLISRGLLWSLYNIWFDVEYYDNLSTVWTDEQLTLG